MRHAVASRLQTVLLTSNDVDEIFALYEFGRSDTPYGFLALRTKEHFREVFRTHEHVVGTGIRDNGRLIAYSICHRIARNPYPDNPVLSAVDPTSTIYHGDGTVVHPAYHGRMLAQRIARLRWEQIAERRIEHVLGLVAVDNIVSIGNVVLAGGLLVGFARDETSMNYIAYAGCLRDRLRKDAMPVSVAWHDHEQQQHLFVERNVVCNLNRSNATDSSASGNPIQRRFAFQPLD